VVSDDRGGALAEAEPPAVESRADYVWTAEDREYSRRATEKEKVAFTPKGGCVADAWLWRRTASRARRAVPLQRHAIPPKGGCLLGLGGAVGRTAVRPYKRVFTTSGGVYGF